jgi:hypothetical protein
VKQALADGGDIWFIHVQTVLQLASAQADGSYLFILPGSPLVHSTGARLHIALLTAPFSVFSAAGHANAHVARAVPVGPRQQGQRRVRVWHPAV